MIGSAVRTAAEKSVRPADPMQKERRMADFVTLMLKDGLLTDQSASRVRSLMADGQQPEEAVLGADGVAEESLLKFLSKTYDVPMVELDKIELPKDFIAKFPARLLVQHKLMPVKEEEGIVSVATNKLFDHTGMDELRLAVGKDMRPVLATAADIERCMKKFLGVGADTLQSLMKDEDGLQVVENEDNGEVDLSAAAADASIIKFVNQILTEAIEMRTTDVHFEPFEDQFKIRYRIDGVLQEANIPAQIRKLQPAIVSRIKILAHLDIAEKRLPQDGRIKLKISGREIDVRVSVIPMIHGEAVVLRLLARDGNVVGIASLGMAARDFKIFKNILDLPHGIVLVTGPTGSGKTTTLYAGLSEINTADRKIITVEDPVEYQLKGINQIHVNTKAGLTFASGLRAILRHDPDVVLIGEIRDKETAEIAVQASLTGHLVFSTLHTNDAPGAAPRLIDMGVEPYLVASSLELVLAQRLVRVICQKCKEEVPESELKRLRDEFGELVPAVVYRGRGCRNCQNLGYRGRHGIFEMMVIDDDIRSLIIDRAPAQHIRKAAAKQQMNTLRRDGWRLIHQGITTPDEVLTATKDEHVEVKFDAAEAALAATNFVAPGGT